jgi:histidinol dehydrogenase
VHAAGGAQALAMFAYGTGECVPVDVITGPGNVYVAAAKRILQGQVGIDGENGPTEIGIIADHTADPAYLAADLIGQAEHDELAACLLITTDADLPARVDEELQRQLPATKHKERVSTALSNQAGYVIVDDIDAASAVSDAWAPEHLEVQTEDAAKVASEIRNAGAVFVGPYSPVSLGDYLAGSNHVLPTGGTARHTSGLSVYPYLKVVNVIECDRDSLAAVAPRVDAIGGAEDLAAHVAAVRVRVPRDGQ